MYLQQCFAVFHGMDAGALRNHHALIVIVVVGVLCKLSVKRRFGINILERFIHGKWL